MDNRILMSKNILNASSLGTVFEILHIFSQQQNPEQMKDTDEISTLINESMGNDIFNMNEKERLEMANKMRMLQIYLDQQLMTNQTRDLSNTLAIAKAIESKCMEYIINVQSMYEVDNFENYLDDIYGSFRENIKTLNLNKLNETKFTLKHANEEKNKLYTQPFDLICEKLQDHLRNVKKVSGLMHFIYGDRGNEDFSATTADGKEFASLKKRKREIEKSNLTQQEKAMQMEQAILDIYWHIRKNQGFISSRLGNELENFINSENGLNLKKKYGYLATVPHNVKGLADQAFKLEDIKNAAGDEIKHDVMQLKIRLSNTHLKTDRRVMKSNLLQKVEAISDAKDLDAFQKERQIKLAICQTYLEAQAKADKQWFFHHEPLADALKDYLKNKYGMDVGKIKKLVEDNKVSANKIKTLS